MLAAVLAAVLAVALAAVLGTVLVVVLGTVLAVVLAAVIPVGLLLELLVVHQYELPGGHGLLELHHHQQVLHTLQGRSRVLTGS